MEVKRWGVKANTWVSRLNDRVVSGPFELEASCLQSSLEDTPIPRHACAMNSGGASLLSTVLTKVHDKPQKFLWQVHRQGSYQLLASVCAIGKPSA